MAGQNIRYINGSEGFWIDNSEETVGMNPRVLGRLKPCVNRAQVSERFRIFRVTWGLPTNLYDGLR